MNAGSARPQLITQLEVTRGWLKRNEGSFTGARACALSPAMTVRRISPRSQDPQCNPDRE